MDVDKNQPPINKAVKRAGASLDTSDKPIGFGRCGARVAKRPCWCSGSRGGRGELLIVVPTATGTARLRLGRDFALDAELAARMEALPGVGRKTANVVLNTAFGEATIAVDTHIFRVANRTGMPVALEAALKFKETCGIQAEAFSSAEVKHGPMAVVEDGFPMIVFAPRGPAQAGLLALADDMRSRGARVLLAAPEGTPGAELPLALADHEDLDPIVAIQSFYQMVESLSRARGRNPDKPMHLSKVTLTQ